MHTLFLLNPAAGKADCTRTLPQQIAAAAAGAGLAPEDYTIRVTTHAGHARELSRAAAAAAQKAGVELHIFTAGGDGTFNEALPVPTALIRPPWAACPMAAATTFCAPTVQRRSFWIWTPSWPAGWCPST